MVISGLLEGNLLVRNDLVGDAVDLVNVSFTPNLKGKILCKLPVGYR